jgi:hypothetical protein
MAALKPRRPYVRIDTKKDDVTIDRGWPIEGHGTRTEVMTLLYIGTVGFLGGLVKMFPKHRQDIADYLRAAAEAVEKSTNGALPWIPPKKKDEDDG